MNFVGLLNMMLWKMKNVVLLIIAALSGNVFAQTFSTINLPQLTAYSRGEPENDGGGNVYRTWTFSVKNTPVTIPDSELDSLCDYSACRLTILVPSSTNTGQLDRAFSLTSAYIYRGQSIRELLKKELPSGSKKIINEGINGYIPREGCGWTQIDNVERDYPGYSYSEAEYKARALPLPKLQEALSGCVITSPNHEYCAMDTVSLNFDFGTIIQSHWNTAPSQFKKANVYCTGDVKYKIRSIPSTIMLNNGGSVDVFIDNKPSEEMLFNGEAGINQHEIKVSLSSQPNMSGSFSGGGALVVAYP